MTGAIFQAAGIAAVLVAAWLAGRLERYIVRTRSRPRTAYPCGCAPCQPHSELQAVRDRERAMWEARMHDEMRGHQ